MSVRVVETDPATDPRWNSFVVAHPGGSVFHDSGWLDVIRRTYSYRPLALAAEEDGRLAGVLPLFYKRGLVTGRRLVSLPHSPLGGPLANEAETTARLLRSADETASARRLQLQIRSASPGFDDLVPGMACVPRGEAYLLELPDDPEALRFGSARNHSRVRWAVNKAHRSGIRVTEGSGHSALRRWYRVYSETLRRRAVPPQPFELFREIWNAFAPRGMVRLLLAGRPEDGHGDVLAGALFLLHRDTVYYAYSGARRDNRDRASDLIQWQAIHDACATGFRRYDMGVGLERDAGVNAFKRKFGAAPGLRFRYYSPPPRSVEGRDVDLRSELYRESGGRARQLGDAVWRRLPVRSTVVIGGLMYRYL